MLSTRVFVIVLHSLFTKICYNSIFRYDICNIFNKKKIDIKNTVNERKTLKTGVVYFEFVSPIVNLAKASTIMKNTKSRME